MVIELVDFFLILKENSALMLACSIFPVFLVSLLNLEIFFSKIEKQNFSFYLLLLGAVSLKAIVFIAKCLSYFNRM